MSAFIKHDQSKLRFDLLDAAFEEELADILTHGATKYADDNWKLAEPTEAKRRYYAAMRRHMNAWAKGEVYDTDSGRPHLISAACSLMFLRWFERGDLEAANDFADEREALQHALEERIDELVDDDDEPGYRPHRGYVGFRSPEDV